MSWKRNISRRDFLKVMLTSVGAFLASCLPQATGNDPPEGILPTETPTEPPEIEEPVLNNNVPEGGDEDPPEPEPTETPTEVPTEEPFCIQLLTPENEAILPMVGKVTFSWEPMPGAEVYLLEITLPNGTVVPFETQLTYRDQYIEAFTMGGIFTWQVSAFDAKSILLCTSDVFSFEKPAFEQQKNNGGREGDGNGTGSTGSWSVTSF
jgi:hypothetical protein